MGLLIALNCVTLLLIATLALYEVFGTSDRPRFVCTGCGRTAPEGTGGWRITDGARCRACRTAERPLTPG